MLAMLESVRIILREGRQLTEITACPETWKCVEVVVLGWNWDKVWRMRSVLSMDCPAPIFLDFTIPGHRTENLEGRKVISA